MDTSSADGAYDSYAVPYPSKPMAHPLRAHDHAPSPSASTSALPVSPALPPLLKRTKSSDDDEESASKSKKKRQVLSCGPCAQRKIKCDRKLPCSSCIRRKMAESCNWNEDPNEAPSFALNSDVRTLSRRLAHLESLFAAQSSPSAFNSPQAPSIPSRHRIASPREDTRAPHSDTEDAANGLEDVAFEARVPILRTMSKVPTYSSTRLTPGQDRPGAELTSAGTSILVDGLLPDQDGRPRSAVRLGLDLSVPTGELLVCRSAAMAQIFAVLPGKHISDFLLQKYFSEINWDFAAVDVQSFIPEHERYFEMRAAGRQDSIDPLWIAVYCMVLSLSLDGFWGRPDGARDLGIFGGMSEKALQDLPSVWHDSALRSLQIGEWGGAPRIRTVQTIILFGQYIQIASSSGQQGRFLGWAASGIRVAQRLGLHRLGSNPETMPPDDPALPPGKNSVKRESAVRLFNMLVYIDSILSDSTNLRCYLLNPHHYNTALPSNLNRSDLSPTEWRTIPPHPLNIQTDASFEIAQAHLAAQVRRALDELVLSCDHFSYAGVMEQDREFRRVLDNLPSPSMHEPIRVQYQRGQLVEATHARLLRLHRPFLSRGYTPGSPYRYSTEQCVKSARLIVAANFDLLRITNSRWWIYTATLGSAIVALMDVFSAIDEDLSEEEITEKKDVLVKAKIIFDAQVSSPALQAVVEQGRKIMAGLIQAQEGRRATRAAQTLVSASGTCIEVESFSHVLKRISHELSSSEEFPSFTPLPSFPPPHSHYPPPLSYSTPDFLASDIFHEGTEATIETNFFQTLESEDWAGTGRFSGSESEGGMPSTW